ncbi:hypothetical protein J2735_001665 [Agrobacterium tumefaciens]|nr:hypothetical protein [Agrobacterium tumefaciens]
MPLRIENPVLESEERRRDSQREKSDGKTGRRETQRQGGGRGEEVQRGHGQQPAEKAAREEKRDYVGGVVGFQPVPDIEADGGGRG